MSIEIHEHDEGVHIPVHAQPRASRTELAGEYDGALKVRLAAPPVDGDANEELVKFLAKTLDVPKSAVRLASGMTGRKKLVEVDGIDADAVRKILAAG